jgi:uncharacterized protein
MKKVYFLVIFFSVLTIVKINAQIGHPINIGKIDTIYSRILDEKRTVWVYVPNTDVKNKFAKVKYPVIYLLDGDLAFSSIVGMTQYLSSSPLGLCPEVIVVGIIHKDRFKDLTPTNVKTDTSDKNTSGGGEKFLSYIENEVMPYINYTYPTLPYNVFVGHSLGGLTVMQTFIHHYSVFNAYISLDASMSWDNQKLLNETKTLLKKVDTMDKPLYLAIANTMKAGMDTSTIKKDITSGTLHIRSLLELEQLLKVNKKNFSSIYYSNYAHRPSFLTGTYDGLLFLFKNFKFILKENYFSTSSFDALQRELKTHFAKFSSELGFKYNPPEKLINTMGNDAMSRKQMIQAEYLFKLNITNYPTSFNAFDVLANFYVTQNNKDKAIEYFKKALSIKNVKAARVKLKQLELK